MPIEIREVTTQQDLKTFIRFPHLLYKANPYWVPGQYSSELKTLSKETNPAFKHSQSRYWLALRDGKVVGRVAAIISEGHRQRWNQAYMRFGWIDFVDDLEVSKTLMTQVENWAREKDLTAVHGPLGFSDMDQAGMLVEGFNELGTLATIYNYPYYPRHLEALGYVKDVDWVEYEIVVPKTPDDRIARLAQIVQRRENLHLLEFKNRNEVLQYAPQIFALINEGYQNLYGYVPLNDDQVRGYTRQYLGFIQPEFLPVIINAQGQMVAFGITMPSLSHAMQKANGRLYPLGFLHVLRALKKNDRADLYLVVVKPEYQGRGVNALLIDHIWKIFSRHGIRKVESNPELETNLLVQGQWKHFEKRQHKRRRSYIKLLV
jgi:ribosomal protein S18 acetylase RimI-like enzyme